MKRAIALILVLMMVLPLAACAPQEEAPVAEAATEAPAEGTGELSTQEVEVVEAEAYKEHITIALDSVLKTMDPQLYNARIANIFYYLTHDRLIHYNSSTGEYEPELAESWEWVEPLVLELKLRQDVTFHDGNPFTAADVQSTLDRATDTTVTNFYEHSEILDDYTIRIYLSKANVDFIATLSHNVMAITSKKAVEADPDNGALIGTGTWVIDEVISGDRVELSANESYWGELPKTKTMTVRWITEAAARLIALQNGEIDIMTKVDNAEIEFAKQDENIEVNVYPSSECVYLCMNTSKAPGNDINMRTALAHAINRDEIIAVIGDSGAMPATSYYNWSGFGYFDDFEKDISFDTAKAAEFAAKTTSPKIAINVCQAITKLMAQMIQEQCRQAGIEVTINEMDQAALSASNLWDGGDHEATITSISFNPWANDIARVTTVGSNSNKSHVDDPELQALLEKGVATTDEAERLEIYKQIQTLIHDNVYWIPLVYVSGNVAYAKGMSGIVIEPNNSHDFSYACLPIS